MTEKKEFTMPEFKEPDLDKDKLERLGAQGGRKGAFAASVLSSVSILAVKRFKKYSGKKFIGISAVSILGATSAGYVVGRYLVLKREVDAYLNSYKKKLVKEFVKTNMDMDVDEDSFIVKIGCKILDKFE